MEKKIPFLSLLMIIPLLIIPAFAEDMLLVETNKQKYLINEELEISGEVKEKKMPEVALRIYDPDGMILSANNVGIDDDNHYSKSITLDSPFYDKIGTYRIAIDYGVLSVDTNFEIITSEQGQPSDSSPIEIISEKIVMNTSKLVYYDEEFIQISGSVLSLNAPSILIGIHDPFGFPAGFYFAPIDSNNEFFVEFLAKSGVNFKTEGTHSAVAHYGDTKNTIYFDFSENEIIIEEPVDENNSVEEPVDENNSVEEPVDENNSVEEQYDEPSIIVIPEVVNTQKTITNIPQDFENLSVDDTKLENMLNEIKSNCDTNEYDYSISYDDGMGSALVRLCKYDQAIVFYDQILVNDPKNVVIINDKASALSNLGLFDEALLHYESALSINPNFIPALNNKANTLIQLGHFDEAILLYEESLDIDHENIILKRNLEKAKADFKQENMDSNTSESKRGIVQDEKNSINSNSLSLFENMLSSLEGFFSIFS